MRFQKWPTWKIVLVAVIIIVAICLNVCCLTYAYAEEQECWVLCQPDSYVNARLSPSKRSMEIGRLECGDKIYTDGKVKNGYLHCYVGFEYGEGWVKKGYIVYSKPYYPPVQETTIISNGRVNARKTINGDRRCWLKSGQKIKVYMMSDEWSVTNKGFVRTEFVNGGR